MRAAVCSRTFEKIQQEFQRFHRYFSGGAVYDPGEIRECYTRFLWAAFNLAKEVNLFAAATFAFAVSRQSLSFSVLLSAVFWCVAYLSYGLVVLLSKRKPRLKEGTVLQPEPPADIFTPSVRPARSNVRTEHAISVTEKLLQADLSKGDRQEAERIKSTLAFLKAKPDLTPADNDLLNEKFNTLLKLMAKYD